MSILRSSKLTLGTLLSDELEKQGCVIMQSNILLNAVRSLQLQVEKWEIKVTNSQ
jgi:hypothetical protein